MAVRGIKEYPEIRLLLDAVAAALQVPPGALRAAIVDKVEDAVHRSACDLTPVDAELLVLYALSERLPTAEETIRYLSSTIEDGELICEDDRWVSKVLTDE